MHVIQLNQAVFLAHVAHMNQLQQALNAVPTSIPELTGDSTVLREYHLQYTQFLTMIKDYSQLLQRDVQLMQQSSSAIVAQDTLLGTTFRK